RIQTPAYLVKKFLILSAAQWAYFYLVLDHASVALHHICLALKPVSAFCNGDDSCFYTANYALITYPISIGKIFHACTVPFAAKTDQVFTFDLVAVLLKHLHRHIADLPWCVALDLHGCELGAGITRRPATRAPN